jgi:type I restriction enzyme S subunit
MNNKIPKGWIQVKLGEIAEIIPGISFKPEQLCKQDAKNVRILRGGNIQNDDYFLLEDDYFVPKDIVSDDQLLRRYDIILVSSTGSKQAIGKAAIIKEELNNLSVGAFLKVIRIYENIQKKYIGFYFYTLSYRNYIREIVKGVNINNIKDSYLNEMFLPLPPLPEQQRIVTKIEELFTKLDAGMEALKKAREQIKRYRQAVLKYAFEGKLTEEWREANRDKLESASVLLERIKEERKKKLGKKYRELPPVDLSARQAGPSELPELPKGWMWVRLGEIANDINPGFASGKHNKDNMGIPHLRPMNINFKGEIDLSNIKYVQPEKEFDKLMRGDILFNNTNSPELLGKTCYIKENTNWAYSNHMTRIRVNESLVNPAWISYCLHTLFLNGFFKLNCTHHVNQASINTTFLSERIYIPSPPLPEQHRIVEEIERRLSIADATEKTIDQCLKQAERLRQSILKMAFEGKLVPQDPNDEPAEKLLERIKEEKEKKSVNNRSSLTVKSKGAKKK